jgi:hypothetical protein
MWIGRSGFNAADGSRQCKRHRLILKDDCTVMKCIRYASREEGKQAHRH